MTRKEGRKTMREEGDKVMKEHKGKGSSLQNTSH